MDEAAPQAAGEVNVADVERALEYLRLLWGSEFMIGRDDQGYWAAPYGQIGKIVRAASPEELGEKMNGAGQ